MGRIPIALIGDSGSGKTTLMAALIEHYTRRGEGVSAIKHSHHELTHHPRGDTEAFLDAGAAESILVSGRRAAAFQRLPVRFSFVWDFEEVHLLPAMTIAPVVLIEGFKSVRLWPRLLIVARGQAPPEDRADLAAIVSDDPPKKHPPQKQSDIPTFSPDRVSELARFLDRITAR